MMGVLPRSTPHEAKDYIWSEIRYAALSCDSALLLQDVVSGGRKRMGKYAGSGAVIEMRRRLMVVRAYGKWGVERWRRKVER